MTRRPGQSLEEWAREQLDQYKDDPEFIEEQRKLDEIWNQFEELVSAGLRVIAARQRYAYLREPLDFEATEAMDALAETLVQVGCDIPPRSREWRDQHATVHIQEEVQEKRVWRVSLVCLDEEEVHDGMVDTTPEPGS